MGKSDAYGSGAERFENPLDEVGVEHAFETEPSRLGEATFDNEATAATVTAAARELPSVSKPTVLYEEDTNEDEHQTYRLWTILRYYTSKDLVLLKLGVAAAIGCGVGDPFMYSMFGDLIDEIYSAKTGQELGETFQFYGMLFMGLASGILVVALVQMFTFEWVSERQSSSVRTTYLRAILRQDSAYFDSLKHGALELPGSVAIDALALRDGFGFKASQALRGLATFCLSVTLAYLFGWQVAISMSGTFVLILTSQAMAVGRITKHTEKDLASYAIASGYATETLTNIKTVAAFGAEAEREAEYSKRVAETKAFGLLQSTWTAAVQAFPFPCLFISVAIATGWGKQLVRNDLVYVNSYTNMPWTTGDVLRVMYLMETAAGGLAGAAPGLTFLARARASLNRVMSTIDRIPTIDSYSNDGKTLSNLEGNIYFNNVSFRYPARDSELVIKNLTLTCLAGQRIAFVGGSGAGKSTLISMILRLYDVSEGSVLVDGVDIRALSIVWLRKQIGLVSQEPVLFGTATLAENIRFGKPDATMQDIVAACKAANIHDFIACLPNGYDTRVGQSGSGLSGGQKQRVAIARAMIRDPKIMLLDEATSALDSESERAVKEALDRLMQGRTTIVVAHRLSTIEDADRIYVMDRGEICEQGTHSELLAKQSSYASLIARQQMDAGGSDSESEEEKVVVAFAATATIKDSPLEALAGLPAMDVASDAGLVQMDPTDMDPTDTDPEDEAIVPEKKEGLKKVTFSQLVAKAGNKRCMLYVSAFSACFVGSQFPFLHYVTAEVMDTLSMCTSTEICDDSDPAPALNCTLIYGRDTAQSPSFTDAQNCYELQDSDTRWLIIEISTLCSTVCCGTFLQFKGLLVVEETVKASLRTDMFRSLLKQDMEFFDNPANSPGSLASKLASDTKLAAAGFGMSMAMLIQAGCCCVVSLAASLWYCWQLTLVLLAVLPVAVIAEIYADSLQWNAAKQAQSATAEATSIATEAVSAFATVATFQMAEPVIKLYDDAISNSTVNQRKALLATALVYGISASLAFVVPAVALLYGGHLVGEEGYDTHDVMMSFLLVLGMVFGMTGAIAYLADTSKSKAATQSAFEIIELEPSIYSEATDEIPAVLVDEIHRADLVFENVAFAYPARQDAPIFEKLSLTIPAGKQTAIVARTGCGKSTVYGLLQRFYDPSAGQVTLGGHRLDELPVDWLRAQMGLVAQEPCLFSDTIENNIKLGRPDASHEEVEQACRRANAHDFISRLADGYATEVGARGGLLSGGQKQRLAIARAILREPAILLLDEATSALDSESEKVVQEALDNAKVGRTTIIIAHRLNTVKASDHILVLAKTPVAPYCAELCEEGTHTELIAKRGEYFRLASKGLSTDTGPTVRS